MIRSVFGYYRLDFPALTRRSLGLLSILLFSAVLAHAQIDPRCSNPTATGQFTCTIDQPNVTQRETVLPNIVFAAGDTVVIGAGGCVQTGGVGSTWKLYVNPSGPNSDHLYHGLIRIPTATPGTALVRIKDIIGQNMTVAGNLPQSQLVLHLGYEDDDYSDNSYNDHDDGTEDQCKNIGPAQVRVVITRGVTGTGGDTGKFAFNLVWSELAPGGLPLNPQWAWQKRIENAGYIPDTSLCHNFSKTVQATGPGGQNILVRVPDFADCTDQTGPNNVDVPDSFNSFICSFADTNSFTGHVNWFPVTFVGTAGWGDHGVDDDYTFEFRRDGNPLSVNGRAGLHIEFDSEETIDNFMTDEWKSFHQAVDASGSAKALLQQCNTNNSCNATVTADLQKSIDAPKNLFNGQTILTGMYGLDCEHDCKGELHPLYAMATKRDFVETDQADEVWLMFVRNVGDEGYCSSQLWKAPFTNYTFRLPWRDGMSSVEVLWGVNKSQFEGTAGTSGPRVTYMPSPGLNSGVYVSFTLPSASQSPLIDGALHLKWTASPGSLQTRRGSNGPGPTNRNAVISQLSGTLLSATDSRSQEIDEAEHKILAAVGQLPPAQQKEIQKARASASVRAALHPLPQGGPAQKITTSPAVPRINLRLDARAGAAAPKRERDAAQMKALCAATNNAPAGLPAQACDAASSPVRVHR
jgi:hypothetical protein